VSVTSEVKDVLEAPHVDMEATRVDPAQAALNIESWLATNAEAGPGLIMQIHE